MELLLFIALLCFLNTILPDFLRNYIKISRFISTKSHVSLEFQAQLDKAREELDNVRKAEHAGEYSRTIKIMRAEEKVKAVESKMDLAIKMNSMKQSTIDTIACYATKVILTIVLIVVSMRNRSTPVMVFDSKINFQPFGSILSFPTGVPNAISVPIWALSCNLTFRLIYNTVLNRV